MLPEKLPVPTGTAVNVHIEVAMPEPKPYVSVEVESKDWYEQSATLRQTIYQRRGEFAGDSVQDLYVVREARESGCELWTADENLVKNVSADFLFVKWLKDYQPKATGQPP